MPKPKEPEVFVLYAEADYEGIQYLISVHGTEAGADAALKAEVKARRHRKRDLDISRAKYFK
jgi:hypothetical protein|tara:strand:- start:3157 stop:3342 length:186 start_codon:yes stop_codon:yes gene_type:complete